MQSAETKPLWWLEAQQDEIRHTEKLLRDAEECPTYAEVAKHNCGRLDLARKSDAVVSIRDHALNDCF
jgi:hypothetical protein